MALGRIDTYQSLLFISPQESLFTGLSTELGVNVRLKGRSVNMKINCFIRNWKTKFPVLKITLIVNHQLTENDRWRCKYADKNWLRKTMVLEALAMLMLTCNKVKGKDDNAKSIYDCLKQ